MIYGIFYQTIIYPKFGLPFYQYILAFVFGALVIVYLDYIKLSPSVIAYGNHILKEQNPILTELAEVRKENAELKEMIRIIIDLK